MHESLTKTLALEDQAPVPAPLTDSAQLKHFAREAEVNGNFELATKYYQEVGYLTESIFYNKTCHWFCTISPPQRIIRTYICAKSGILTVLSLT